MSLSLRTLAATILRQLNQGLLTPSEAYHALCHLHLEYPHHD